MDSHLESNFIKSLRIPCWNTYLRSKKFQLAQSATKERALLGIEPFWERPILEPPLRWERWRLILKLAILANEGSLIDILREAPPGKVTFPPKPNYEEDGDKKTAQSERDRRIRNE